MCRIVWYFHITCYHSRPYKSIKERIDMSIFSGLNNATSSGTGSQRGEFFHDGSYRVSLLATIAKEAFRKDGQPGLIIETQIEEVLRQTEDSNSTGQKAVAMYKLARTPSGELTQTGQINLERVKGFFAQALGGVEDALVTEEIVGQLTEGTGDALKGVQLQVDVKTKVSEKTGNPFTHVYWRFVPEWNPES